MCPNIILYRDYSVKIVLVVPVAILAASSWFFFLVRFPVLYADVPKLRRHILRKVCKRQYIYFQETSYQFYTSNFSQYSSYTTLFSFIKINMLVPVAVIRKREPKMIVIVQFHRFAYSTWTKVDAGVGWWGGGVCWLYERPEVKSN